MILLVNHHQLWTQVKLVTDNKQFRLLRSAEDPENEDITAANFSAVVCINLIELQS